MAEGMELTYLLNGEVSEATLEPCLRHIHEARADRQSSEVELFREKAWYFEVCARALDLAQVERACWYIDDNSRQSATRENVIVSRTRGGEPVFEFLGIPELPGDVADLDYTLPYDALTRLESAAGELAACQELESGLDHALDLGVADIPFDRALKALLLA